jgi:hypothetical protein
MIPRFLSKVNTQSLTIDGVIYTTFSSGYVRAFDPQKQIDRGYSHAAENKVMNKQTKDTRAVIFLHTEEERLERLLEIVTKKRLKNEQITSTKI